jgi:ribosomal protein S18 acetylase RimI-like enzyme
MNLSFINLDGKDMYAVRKMSELAKPIVKEHYDPIIGSAQNDYMISLFQTEEAIASQIEHGYEYYFASDEIGNIGFFAFYQRENGLYLSKLYLKKEERGKGYSRRILSFLIDKAKEKGLDCITLNVNKKNNAIEVYKKLGFEIIREEKNDIGHGFFMDDYVMRYNIIK